MAEERKISEKDRNRLVDCMRTLEQLQVNFQLAVERKDMLMELFRERYDMTPEEQIRYQDGVIMLPEPAPVPPMKIVEKGAKPKEKEA